MRDLGEIVMDLWKASAARDNQAVANLVLELGPMVLVFAELPDGIVGDLTRLLADEGFRSLVDSWRLAYFFDDNWDLLALHHRNSLRPVLEECFDKFQDSMGAFVIGEMLGRRYGDEEAFKVLARLASTARLPARALAPHGLETLARSTKSARLRDLSVHKLRELAKSPERQVREEAAISLVKATESVKRQR